ncbi:LPXTG cell wall anchor domain-containing protein, partial [Staphylococcus epidermidis]
EPGTPAEPGKPAEPGTPAEPGKPAEPGTPAEPGKPVEPGTPAQSGAPEQPNRSMHSTDNKNQLPDTGENRQANEGTLVGSLLAIVGSLFIFGRRKKGNEK